MATRQRIYHIWNISKWCMKPFIIGCSNRTNDRKDKPKFEGSFHQLPEDPHVRRLLIKRINRQDHEWQKFLARDKPLMERSLEFGLIIPVVGAIWATDNNTVHHTAVGIKQGGLGSTEYITIRLASVVWTGEWMNGGGFVWVWNDVTRPKTAGISRRRNEDFSNESNTKIC